MDPDDCGDIPRVNVEEVATTPVMKEEFYRQPASVRTATVRTSLTGAHVVT